ncbi:hypothetical protein PTSG_08238 [Salpingoeca rosetta]|uniref:Uncharacterized protein n=1 Tax=Salpingoeca rosetta (strain ATCC 50818 / BSB-021) TaxID=946362 RepID=F2UIE3_SALR5|nr:uncharacterized protein PTSG_08238 [Salpingoeca rosetta]XP_012493092.1 hypothetical protein, variant [Salpingoeca rosetta]EGD76892.1 hypothetical protein, variant [Salpingoeca rosetta]EGD76893.1 hypothetical protein PTSG_08238 [Salpingoeca rosetta]|eukprot:XP_004991264.1 hypothetical protein PTSG_08238 [Salpingoeca rosetta]
MSSTASTKKRSSTVAKPKRHRRPAGVEPPAAEVLGVDAILDAKGKPRIDVLREHFRKEGVVTEEAAIQILITAGKVLKEEPTLLEVPAPVTGVPNCVGMGDKDDVEKRREKIRNKIRAVGKVSRMFSTTAVTSQSRQASESVDILRGMSPSGSLPKGVLSAGPLGVEQAIQGFDDAKQADAQNERMPPQRPPTDPRRSKRPSTTDMLRSLAIQPTRKK